MTTRYERPTPTAEQQQVLTAHFAPVDEDIIEMPNPDFALGLVMKGEGNAIEFHELKKCLQSQEAQTTLYKAMFSKAQEKAEALLAKVEELEEELERQKERLTKFGCASADESSQAKSTLRTRDEELEERDVEIEALKALLVVARGVRGLKQ